MKKVLSINVKLASAVLILSLIFIIKEELKQQGGREARPSTFCQFTLAKSQLAMPAAAPGQNSMDRWTASTLHDVT